MIALGNGRTKGGLERVMRLSLLHNTERGRGRPSPPSKPDLETIKLSTTFRTQKRKESEDV